MSGGAEIMVFKIVYTNMDSPSMDVCPSGVGAVSRWGQGVIIRRHSRNRSTSTTIGSSLMMVWFGVMPILEKR